MFTFWSWIEIILPRPACAENAGCWPWRTISHSGASDTWSFVVSHIYACVQWWNGWCLNYGSRSVCGKRNRQFFIHTHSSFRGTPGTATVGTSYRPTYARIKPLHSARWNMDVRVCMCVCVGVEETERKRVRESLVYWWHCNIHNARLYICIWHAVVSLPTLFRRTILCNRTHHENVYTSYGVVCRKERKKNDQGIIVSGCYSHLSYKTIIVTLNFWSHIATLIHSIM